MINVLDELKKLLDVVCLRSVCKTFGRDELRVKFLAWNMRAELLAADRGAACVSGLRVAMMFKRNIVVVVRVSLKLWWW